MSKQLAKRSVSLGSNTTMIVLGLAVIGLLVYFLLKKNAAAAPPPAGTYTNKEVWAIKWDPDTMLPLEIEVHRDAVRS